jgi:hypothetical protein
MIEVEKLTWDEQNIAHIARHEVTKDEVEQFCYSDAHPEEGYLGRIRLVGATNAGRMLAFVLARKGDGVYYVVTARPASRTSENDTMNAKEVKKLHDKYEK